MRCVDVNVLVYAHRPEAPEHEAYRAWFDRARSGVEQLGIAPIVASGFLRVVTHPRIFKEPTPLSTAIEFLDVVHNSPATVPVLQGHRHWQIFKDLCRHLGARGNAVPDAYLAAIAIEQGAAWISADRAFAGFPDLQWSHPLDA